MRKPSVSIPAPPSLADGQRPAVKPSTRTLYLLKRAETASRLRLEAALQDLSISPGQYATLSLLRTHREFSSAELARLVGVTPQTMWETVATLERNGLIRRSESPANRRILRAELTPAGTALAKACDARADKLERELFAGLDGEQLAALRAALALIATREGR